MKKRVANKNIFVFIWVFIMAFSLFSIVFIGLSGFFHNEKVKNLFIDIGILDGNGLTEKSVSKIVMKNPIKIQSPEDIIADHNSAREFYSIPAEWINTAKSNLRIYYGHTSHGRQITNGMQALNSTNSTYNYLLLSSEPASIQPGALNVIDINGDLANPDTTTWYTRTRTQLNSVGNRRNVVIWAWCAGELQVISNTTLQNDYLNNMIQLENDFPNVIFIYMTGPADGRGVVDGEAHVMNNIIRNFFANDPNPNKALYDFEDIESYDPSSSRSYMPACLEVDAPWGGSISQACIYNRSIYNANSTPTKSQCFQTIKGSNWAEDWIANNTAELSKYPCAYYERDGNPSTSCSLCLSDSHTHPLNCDLKTMAFWWMMARIAGWEENSSDTSPPIISSISNISITNNSVFILWNTNENANATVMYGITTSLGSNASNSSYSLSHNIQLASLQQNTTYYYRVKSCDASGNCANSSLLQFRTLSNTYTDGIPPTIVLNSPVNSSTSLLNQITFSYTPSDGGIVSNCTIYISGGSLSNSTNVNFKKQVYESAAKRHGSLDFNYTQNFPSASSVIAKEALTRAPFGLYTWGNDWASVYYYDLNQGSQFKKVGLKTWRISYPYGLIMPDNYMDNIADFSNETGSEIMYTLYAVQRVNFGEFNNTTNDQKFIDAFLNYSNIMMGRFGPNGTYFRDNPGKPYKPIMYWELLNEPNGFMMGVERNMFETSDLYARLLIQFHNNVSRDARWGDVKIVAVSGDRGGDVVSEGGLSWVDRVHQRVVANGGNISDVYDILSDHPYIHDAPPDVEYDYGGYSRSSVNMEAEVRRVMNNYGINKPVYITEMGWSRSNGLFPAEGPLPWINESFQAAYVIRFYLISLRLGVEAVNIFMNTDANGDNCGFFNVYNFSHWYEEAYAAKNLVNILPNPKLKSVINENNGYYAYVIDSDSNSGTSNDVTVAWNAAGPMNASIPCQPGTYDYIDMLGNSKSKICSGSSMVVEIGPFPIYLRIGAGFGFSLLDNSIENGIVNNFIVDLSNGNYSWDISCYDNSGNLGKSETRFLNVYNTSYSCIDNDRDKYNTTSGACGNVIDCDDNNALVHPGTVEICDGIDNNCVNGIDESNGNCSGGKPYCVSGACVQCTNNGNCDDGLFCNGAETCSLGSCLAGAQQCTLSGQSCDEIADTCRSCTFTGANWNTASIIQGQSVTLTIQGQYCNGLGVNFNVWEDDGILGRDAANVNPASVNFLGNNAVGNWTAEWQCDGNIGGVCTLGLPEYYFSAVLAVNSSVTRDSSLPMLVVNELSPTCGNNITQGGEQCDDANSNNNDACTNACLNAVCGDGYLRSGVEICEIGNTQSCIIGGYTGMRGCNASCNGWNSCVANQSCGDLVCNGLETCSSCPGDCGICPDVTAPIISLVVNSTITNSSAIIRWQTDENATSKVYYGLTTAFGLSVSDASYLISHIINLGNLEGNSTYYYKVGSCDASGNCANSSIYEFKTLDENESYVDNEAPVIVLGVPANATSLGTNSVTFTYTPSDYSVILNCTLFVGVESRVDDAIEKNLENSFVLSLANGDYSWNISCRDARNILGVSETRRLNVNYVAPPPADSGGSGGGGGGGGGSLPVIKPKPKAENVTNTSAGEEEKERIMLEEGVSFVDANGEEKVLVDLYGNVYLVSFVLADGEIVAKLFNGDYVIPRGDVLPIALGDGEVYAGIVDEGEGERVVLGLDENSVRGEVLSAEGRRDINYKKIYYVLIIVVGVLIAAIIALGIWYFISSRKEEENNIVVKGKIWSDNKGVFG